MGRSLFAGDTDYSYQSLSDMRTDLEYWKKKCLELKKDNESRILKLKQDGYWDGVFDDFQIEIDKIMHFFSTVVEELTKINEEIKSVVRNDHIVRLTRLSDFALCENREIGKCWHDRLFVKDYNNSSYRVLERIYGSSRDLVVSLTDLANIASRLQDFVCPVKSNINQSFMNGSTFNGNVAIAITNGDANNVAVSNFNEVKGDVGILERELLNNGFSSEDVNELIEILRTDIPDEEHKEYGAGVHGWMDKVVSKVAQGIGEIEKNVAIGVLTQCLINFYGWG